MPHKSLRTKWLRLAFLLAAFSFSDGAANAFFAPACVYAAAMLDSRGDDPVPGQFDKDDFDTVAEWEAYEKQHPPGQAKGQDSGQGNVGQYAKIFAAGGMVEPWEKTKADAVLRYTLTGLPIKKAIQKTYIDGDYIYVIQRSGTDTYLSRCLIEEGDTAVFKDYMFLENFGHGQTLEGYTYNGKQYFWIACKANALYEQNWSMQIGRIQYEPDGVISNYTKICRFTDLNYANKNGKSFGGVRRVDAALSDDGSKLVFWVRNAVSQMQYSVYKTETLNRLLDQKEKKTSKYVSFKGNKTLKKACLTSFDQVDWRDWTLPNGSFQGIEYSDDGTIYICGGAPGENPGIAALRGSGSSYNYVRLTTVLSDYFGPETETEGIQLKGGTIYLGICDHTDKKERQQYIYSIGRKSVGAASVPSGPAKGDTIRKGAASYKVTKAGKKNAEVQFVKTASGAGTVEIPSTVKAEGITYKVTSIAAKAFYKKTWLKKVTIGKNVANVGKKSFYGCKKLKNIVIKSKKLSAKKTGGSAWKGIFAKASFKVPKGKKASYKKMLIQKGADPKIKVKD